LWRDFRATPPNGGSAVRRMVDIVDHQWINSYETLCCCIFCFPQHDGAPAASLVSLAHICDYCFFPLIFPFQKNTFEIPYVPYFNKKILPTKSHQRNTLIFCEYDQLFVHYFANKVFSFLVLYKKCVKFNVYTDIYSILFFTFI
jgi:hypothetical protein